MERNPARAILQGMPPFSRKQARATARLMVATACDRDNTGKIVRVADPRARQLLERAFTQLLMRGGESFAMQISASEAAAFPSHVPVPGGSYVMAVGFDAQTRATFSTAGAVGVRGDQPIEAADIAQHVAMMGLRRGQQEAGILERGRV